jgi:hypothetical protein
MFITRQTDHECVNGITYSTFKLCSPNIQPSLTELISSRPTLMYLLACESRRPFYVGICHCHVRSTPLGARSLTVGPEPLIGCGRRLHHTKL